MSEMNEFQAIQLRWFDNTCDDPEQAVRDCRTLIICYEVAKRENDVQRQRIAQLEGIIRQHDLCHDLHGKVGREEFEEGCRRETVKQYGSCGWKEHIAQLETMLEQQRTQTYQAVEREHATKRVVQQLEAEVARLTEQITYLQTISTEQVERIRTLEPKDWTDEKPTVPGWYWYKCDEAWCQYDPRIVEIIEYPGHSSQYWTVRGAGINWSLGNLPDCQWSGPIEKPGARLKGSSPGEGNPSPGPSVT